MQVHYCSTAQAEFEWLSGRIRKSSDDVQVLICHYQEPCLIFGLSQRPEDSLCQRLELANMPWLRRRTGGGLVYAGPWLLSTSVILPAKYFNKEQDPIQSYRWFGEVWQSVLRHIGCDSRLPQSREIVASKSEAQRLDLSWACFGAVGHGELVTFSNEIKKILGIAQVRTRHASTLVAGLSLDVLDWRLLCDLVGRPLEQAESLALRNSSLLETLDPTLRLTSEALIRKIEPAFLQVLEPAIEEFR